MHRKIRKELSAIAAALGRSETALPLSLKMRTVELILQLMAKKKGFGLFVILGWQRKWRSYLDISDSRQDIFSDGRHSIMDEASGRHRDHRIAATVEFDGAILIDGSGEIVHSGAMIEGLRPRIVAKKVNPGRYKDLSEQFGFETKVHTRHLSAITASYVFKGTTVFTVSEEDDSFHIFEGGRIIYRMRRVR